MSGEQPSVAAPVPLVLPAELTHAQGRTVLAMLVQTLRAEPQGAVVLDGSPLTRFDSTALAVVLESRRTALAQGRAFAVRSLPAPLRELAGLYGVQDLLPDAAAEAS
ncbi:MAG: STAS domain-containing protein [Comamonas sp.]